ncbi:MULTISPECIES: hypothetical protein [unclassified Bradyrhizobium]|uniref:hypothetical protein n=1 Tax=unclassified Bradyrhizobium TaxID=2631580 RepID=UPI0028EE9CE6|nr:MULTISPECIES: hypothetical protein [unclassified Bradyrhizobium]
MMLGAREGASGDLAQAVGLWATGSGRVCLSRSCQLIRFGLVAAEFEKFTGGSLLLPSLPSIVAEEVGLGADDFSHDSTDAGRSGQRLNQLVHVNPVSSGPPRPNVLSLNSS